MGDVLLLDGAFGTYYASQNGKGRLYVERANIDDAQGVLNIHREYIEAGAKAIATNSFGANTANYEINEMREIIDAGLVLANRAADGKARVFADIGHIQGDDPAAYLEVCRAFLRAGADRFLFETMTALEPLGPTLDAIAAAGDIKEVYISFAASPEGYTRAGLNYAALIQAAMALDVVSAAGINCVCGPAHMITLVAGLRKLPKPLICMPNAGYTDGSHNYRGNTEYFAQKLKELADAGARVVGGCCGTTPAHIAAFSERTRADNTITAQGAGIGGSWIKLPKKPILVEVDPPADDDDEFLLGAAKRLKEINITAMTLADSPLGRSRADSIMCAARVKRETGLDVIPHITCRDKNRVAIKAALLGASMFGIDKVLAVTGDPAADMYKVEMDRKYDFNSFTLIEYIARLSAEALTHPIAVGGALNVNAFNFGGELERAFTKAKCGAGFFLSQPIFSETAAQNFLTAKAAFTARGLNCKFYAGILPVAGYKNALFLNNEVSGIEIPLRFIESLKNSTPEEAAALSVGFAVGSIGAVYDGADGIYIMTPLKRVGLVVRLIEECFI